MLKKIFILVILFSIFPVNQAFSQKRCYNIKDKKILFALDCLKDTDGEWAVNAIMGENDIDEPIKVEFKNLKKISPNFTNDDALGWKDEYGKLMIFINEKHCNAPLPALAALICHESVHQDSENSIQEETYAWAYEAEVWHQLKEKFPELKTYSAGQNALVDRENIIENMYIRSNFSPTILEQKIRNHPSYKNLPENSPGFGN